MEGVGELRAPDLTVIVAIQDGRGQAEACIRRLATEQTLARHRYELLVLAPGQLPRVERVLGEYLEPSDLVIKDPSSNEFLLYNLGAERARGRFLFFVEAHVLPEPDCLERMLDSLVAGGWEGGSCRSVPVAEKAFAEGERELFERSLGWLTDEDHWYKVLIHGFAIDRNLFRRVGGFDHTLGNFAEVALAAALDEGGHSIGYAERARVNHHYLGHLRGLYSYIRDFTHGEMRFRETQPADRVLHYVNHAPEWIDRRSFEGAVARRMARSAAIAGRARPERLGLQGRAGRVARSARLWTRGLAGRRLQVAAARLRLAYRWARAEASRATRRPLLEVYLPWWEAAIHLSRVEYLHEHRESLERRRTGFDATAMGTAEDQHLVGFHALERWRGRPFRWSSDLAAIELDLEPGSYDVRIDLLPVRPFRSVYRPVIVFDDTVVELNPEIRETIRFRVEPEMFLPGTNSHWLVIDAGVFPPDQLPAGERRRLGLPIRGISIEPRRRLFRPTVSSRALQGTREPVR